MDEAVWVDRARRGDQEAWENIIRQHQEAVFRLVYLILGDASQAEDIAQEAFIRAYRSFKRFDPSRPLRPWLLTIAANLARNQQRSASRYLTAVMRLFQDAHPPESAEKLTMRNIEVESLWQAVRKLEFSQDGSVLMVYAADNQDANGINGAAHAILLDAVTLEPLWDLRLDGVLDGQAELETGGDGPAYIWWQPAALLSSPQGSLFVVHADGDQLTTVDFGKRTSETVTVQPKTSLLERLLALTAGVAHAKFANGTMKQAVLSLDGSRLYVVGITAKTIEYIENEFKMEETPLGLQVIDTRSGAEIAHIDSEATELAISADGKTLFLHGWGVTSGWMDLLNTATLKTEDHLGGQSLRSVTRLNGEVAVLSVVVPSEFRTELATYDPATLVQVKDWWLRGIVEVMSP